jgi:two-component system LytT family response regulator
MIKAIIVDDEPPARRELRRLLAEHPDVRIVGEAGDVAAARGLLLRTRPDVVFLDIRLGRESGFDLIPDLDPETSVIFVTAFDAYALKAFEASAIDYLLKPVDARRLESAVARLESGGQKRDTTSRLFASSRWTFIDSTAGQEFIELSSITHIAASDGGSRVFTADRKSRSTEKPLAFWEERLHTGDFVRIHRSTIVNLRFVESVEPWSNYTYRVRLSGVREPVEMSRRYAVHLRDMLA